MKKRKTNERTNDKTKKRRNHEKRRNGELIKFLYRNVREENSRTYSIPGIRKRKFDLPESSPQSQKFLREPGTDCRCIFHITGAMVHFAYKKRHYTIGKISV
jgi:hypothetical protein